MNNSKASRQWEQFEKAVAAFMQALTPNAVVKHNLRLPDKHTGLPRQRDVWVEATVGMFPVKILISCKRLKRKINEQDMDAFWGEFQSSGAHKGVVYAFSGFNEPAINKAKALSISCCKLYQNEPAELPNSLNFVIYCCSQAWRLWWKSEAVDQWAKTSIDEVFAIKSQSDDSKTMLEMLLANFTEGEQRAVQQAASTGRFPENWTASLQIRTEAEEVSPLIISIDGMWKVYKSKLEAHLLNGSYSFTENVFTGSQTSPSIDMKGSHPGPGWELIDERPPFLQPGNGMVILKSGNLREGLLENFTGKKLGELKYVL